MKPIDTSFKKYFIYKHLNGEDISYLHSNTAWVDRFESVYLYDFEDVALHIASNFKKNSTDEGFNFCVGRVIIDVDPLYFPKVV